MVGPFLGFFEKRGEFSHGFHHPLTAAPSPHHVASDLDRSQVRFHFKSQKSPVEIIVGEFPVTKRNRSSSLLKGWGVAQPQAQKGSPSLSVRGIRRYSLVTGQSFCRACQSDLWFNLLGKGDPNLPYRVVLKPGAFEWGREKSAVKERPPFPQESVVSLPSKCQQPKRS